MDHRESLPRDQGTSQTLPFQFKLKNTVREELLEFIISALKLRKGVSYFYRNLLLYFCDTFLCQNLKCKFLHF